MSEFKIGDRVEVIPAAEAGAKKYRYGIVRGFRGHEVVVIECVGDIPPGKRESAVVETLAVDLRLDPRDKDRRAEEQGS